MFPDRRFSDFLLSFYLPVTSVLVLYCFRLSASAMLGNETDELALLELKGKITDDPFGVTSSWNSSNNHCQWYGVTCDPSNQRVTVLNLKSLKLSGSISPYIGNLSFLQELSLQNNSLVGEIPPSIGRLSLLKELSLQHNSLSGEIPANLSACENLLLLGVESNELAGGIPAELGFLKKLQVFSVGGNNLTGTIPLSIWNLSYLQEFYAYENQLVGGLPDAAGRLKNLSIFTVFSNGLSGTFPPSMFNLSSLAVVDVGFNSFQGSLPSDLGVSLPKLWYFSIGVNLFEGTIPLSISNATNLQHLQLNTNNLVGKVPSMDKLQRLRTLTFYSNNLGSFGADDLNFLFSLINISTLKIISIGSNQFGGVLPEYIANFSTGLINLGLENNQLTGSIPTGIETLVSLNRFSVYQNQLSGNIPPGIGKLQNLAELFLFENSLSGEIPASIGNLTNLIRIGLRRNKLIGSIPASLGNCPKLFAVDLSDNELTGAIPPQLLSSSPVLVGLNLSYNHLNGSIPVEVGNLQGLNTLRLSGNELSGGIPSSLGSCLSLQFLYLDGNLLQGSIPSTFSSLRGIQNLNLSQNNLSGMIPEFLEEYGTLEVLNLSYNNFEGSMPVEGAFKNANVTSVKGNAYLCGGIPEFGLPQCNLQQPKERKSSKLKIVISVVSGVTGVVLVLLVCFFLFQSRKKLRAGVPSVFENSFLRVSYQSLLRATNGFSPSNVIGTGSFGSVYKGILHQEGMVVAVKVLHLVRRGALNSFIAECEALRNLRHRNLVKIVTACSGVDNHGNDFKALVYEFMANGSLEDWLHPTFEGENGADGTLRNLDLLQRLNIAIDIACALDYLHHGCQTAVVHCDLKPSNVLLDSKMVAHVGDFGLIRFMSETTLNPASNLSSCSAIRGTVGYTPPEYGTGSEVSTHGDIYSYGILLLEMFTGKRPTDDIFNGGLTIHTMVKNGLPHKVADIADPILLRETEALEEESKGERQSEDGRLECLHLVLEIGVGCSAELPRCRMSMVDVVAQLTSVKEILLGVGTHRRIGG